MTNKRKQRKNVLGQVLGARYKNFLGGIYIPGDIVARSTDNGRTEMSPLLALAGLYPPVSVQRWNPKLPWQPIPTTHLPDALDVLLIPEECPRFVILQARKIKNKFSRYFTTMILTSCERTLRNETPLGNRGKSVTADDTWYLCHNLVVEQAVDLELPEWTNDIFPDGALLDAAILEYDIFSWNDLLKKLNGGTDIKPHVPEYSSAVIIELVSKGDDHRVRVSIGDCSDLAIELAIDTETNRGRINSQRRVEFCNSLFERTIVTSSLDVTAKFVIIIRN